jgi:uncharacterized membrane protein YdjX (TVP38/TMEM64 family)
MNKPQKTHLLKWLVITVCVGITVWAVGVSGMSHHLQRFIDGIESLGHWGALLFILVYVAATVILIPGSILTLGAGAAFGLWKGFFLVSFASTLAASAAFLVGRYLARDWIRRKIGSDSRILAIDAAIGQEQWRIVGLTRLSPLIPFTLLNYALSLTQIRFPGYVLASWIGMIPGTFAYVYLGSLGRIGAQQEKSAGELLLLALGLLATLAVTVLISRAARKVMVEQLKASQPAAATAPHRCDG